MMAGRGRRPPRAAEPPVSAADRSERAREGCRQMCQVGWLLLISALVGGFLGYASSERFTVHTVHVICPNPSLQDEAVERARRISFGTVWLPPTRAIERQIGGLPRARSVTVERKLPDELIIVVTPRVPSAVVIADQRLMAVDDEGVCLHWTGAVPPEQPRLRIEDPLSLRVGGRLGKQDVARWHEIARGLRECGLLAGASIDLSHPLRLSVLTADGVLGKLGNDELLYEKSRLFGELKAALEAQGRKPLYIDLRVPSRPTYKPLK